MLEPRNVLEPRNPIGSGPDLTLVFDDLRRRGRETGRYRGRWVLTRTRRPEEPSEVVEGMTAQDGTYMAASGVRVGYVFLKNHKEPQGLIGGFQDGWRESQHQRAICSSQSQQRTSNTCTHRGSQQSRFQHEARTHATHPQLYQLCAVLQKSEAGAIVGIVAEGEGVLIETGHGK